MTEPLAVKVQPCEVCRTEVHLQVCVAPRVGLPDWVTVTWPDSAWFAWRWEPGERQLTLWALCSHLCLVQWFESQSDSLPPCSMPSTD